MRLLLDTHALLWFALNDPQLSGSAQALISDPAHEVLVSPATYWAIAIKVSLKKCRLHAPYDAFLHAAIFGNGFAVCRSS